MEPLKHLSTLRAPQDAKMYPVLLSNRAGVLTQLGKFEDALKDSEAAVSELDSAGKDQHIS